MRKALAMLAVLASALWAAPAFAESSPKPDLAGWVSQNTDLALSQIAIAGPDNVYSLEPLGPRLPTGEVLALVRTEAVSAEWRDAHQFQSWDAHMLFDCKGERVRVLRSASYAEHDRGGAAKADDRGDAWFSPQAQTPAATLLAAACDVAYNWPLRPAAASPSSSAPGPRVSFVQTASASRAAKVLAVSDPVVAQPPAHIERAAAARLPGARADIMVMAAAAEPRREAAASPDMAQFASPATAQIADRPLGTVGFTAAAIEGSRSPGSPEALGAPRGPGLVGGVVAASQTCRRLVAAGRSWIAERVEIAFHQARAPTRLERGVIRQAQAY